MAVSTFVSITSPITCLILCEKFVDQIMFCTTVDGGWSEWSQWSTCEKPCGGSVVNRTRLCNNPTPSNGGALCNGVNSETKLECLSQCAGKYHSIFCFQ